ncbi:MAG: hypothetical protein IJU23_05700 [Proteobacteria bacterium]|nr:hypothetical protein [Pseudomonadota bacterium]
MDDITIPKVQQPSLENADAAPEIQRLYQIIDSLTCEVHRLSEKVDELEHSPKQRNCILCPHISIRIPINIPLGNTSNK